MLVGSPRRSGRASRAHHHHHRGRRGEGGDARGRASHANYGSRRGEVDAGREFTAGEAEDIGLGGLNLGDGGRGGGEEMGGGGGRTREGGGGEGRRGIVCSGCHKVQTPPLPPTYLATPH